MPLTILVKQGAFDADVENAINANFKDCALLDALAQTLTGNLTVDGTLTAIGAVTLPGVTTPAVQTAAGATDAITFASPINICIVTSTTPDAATLATPGAGDVGKILALINTTTSQTTVTTAANKIVSGASSAGDTLTAPAHAGAVAILIAYNGFWALVVGGTGSWVLSEV